MKRVEPTMIERKRQPRPSTAKIHRIHERGSFETGSGGHARERSPQLPLIIFPLSEPDARWFEWDQNRRSK